MSFVQSVQTCFSKYASFSGRATRAEYWYFFLFIAIVSFCASLVDQILFAPAQAVADAAAESAVSPFLSVVSLAVFLPHLAVAWRRMHDSGRSGLYVLFPAFLSSLVILIAIFGLGLADLTTGSLDTLLTSATLIILIPLIVIAILCPFLMLWWLTRPSQPGPNPYGPNPHEAPQ